jgi:hypothetical protein
MEASASFSPAAARASLFAKLPNNIIIDIVNLEMKRRMNEHRKIHRGKMTEVAMEIRLLRRTFLGPPSYLMGIRLRRTASRAGERQEPHRERFWRWFKKRLKRERQKAKKAKKAAEVALSQYP